MKPILLVALTALTIVSLAQQAATKSEKLFDPKRDAAADIQAAIKKATKERKNILIDVGGDWCSWCHKLDKLFKEDKPIGEALKKNFIVVKVNFSQENENKDVLSKYPKIEGYPHLFVLDSKGNLLHSQDTGLLETGDHHDPQKVMEFLTQWSPKSAK